MEAMAQGVPARHPHESAPAPDLLPQATKRITSQVVEQMAAIGAARILASVNL